MTLDVQQQAQELETAFPSGQKLSEGQREDLVEHAGKLPSFVHHDVDHTYGNAWCRQHCGDDPRFVSEPEPEEPYRMTGKTPHYNQHPSGIECQEIIRECKDPMVAFAMKHLWRSQWGNKPGAPKTLDLQKAIEYLQLELAREQGQARL